MRSTHFKPYLFANFLVKQAKAEDYFTHVIKHILRK